MDHVAHIFVSIVSWEGDAAKWEVPRVVYQVYELMPEALKPCTMNNL